MHKTVFISRDQAPDAEFRCLLAAEGWQLRGQSLVLLAPLPFEALPACDWVFFASKNAVQFFFQQLEKQGIATPKAHWAALGPATAQVLARYVAALDFVGDGAPESSAAALAERLPPGARLLFPAARHAQQSVQRRLADRWPCQHLDVYDNRPLPDAPGSDAAVLVFTSPLNAEAYFSRNALLPGQHVVAIGDTTATALRRLGIAAPRVAAAPDERSLAEAVLALPGTDQRGPTQG
jgi:uroporphyrinogen-III synthase